jgi:hypothetical protein
MSQRIMTVTDLKQVLDEITGEIDGNFEIWLSSDEEGNEFLPMFRNIEFSMSLDKEAKRLIFFPSHR